jgi:uracil permease
VSLILTTGIGGAVLTIGSISLTGIGLSALLGVLLNLVIPQTKEEKAAEKAE